MWSEFLPLFKDWGIPGLAVVAVLTGWLIPRWTHKERVADKDKQIAKQDETIATLLKQRDELMEFAHTTVAAFGSLPKTRERR